MKFEEKVKSMTAKEIVEAMIHGLEKQHVRTRMYTFGDYELIGGKIVCFGCAATNTICEISGKTFHDQMIGLVGQRAQFIDSDEKFLKEFEKSIDYLREGRIRTYNLCAENNGFAVIPEEVRLQFTELPYLSTQNWRKGLDEYKKLAAAL